MHPIKHASITTIKVDVHLLHLSVFPSTEPGKNLEYEMNDLTDNINYILNTGAQTCFRGLCRR